MPAAVKDICPEDVHRLFEYRDGDLYWKVTLSNRAPAGSKACPNPKGRPQVRWNKELYLKSRVIWVYFYGPIPEGYVVDHINLDGWDNRIENLRLLSDPDNIRAATIKRRKNNTSGHRGVSHCGKVKGNWRAYICVNRRIRNLGSYPTKEEAIAARVAAEVEFDRVSLFNTLGEEE